MRSTSGSSMAQTNLTSLFAELNRFGQNGDFERALKTANKILQEARDDEKAFHCKIVCLIQLDKFDEALTAICKNSKLSESLCFERGYCEYRLNRTQDALKTLRTAPGDDYRIQELLGQVLYRLEEYEECLDTYTNLVKNTQDDYEEERETNLSAVLAALQTSTHEEVEDLGLRTDTYEMCYNYACYLIAKGNLDQALDKLKTAEDLCRETFEDEEEIDAELGVIRVQRGYVLQKLGRNDEANRLYNQVLKNKPSDIALTAVASNNVITINKDQNVFDSKKKIKTATADGLQQKLTHHQRETIAMNQCLLYMYMNQGEQCHRMAGQLQQKYPKNDTATLIDAAQYCKDKQNNKATDALKAHITNGKSSSLDVKLALAQLYLGQGSVYQACDTLRSLGDLSHKPGVVSALVSLYLSQEDREAASEVLNNSIDWFRENQPGSSELILLIRANANFQLKNGDPHIATEMLEELRKRNPNDLKILAQLISAYSMFDPKKAESVSRQLPPATELAHDVDVVALETAACTFGTKYIKKVTRPDNSPKPLSPKAGAGDMLLAKKKKKKRKGKLPKNVDPSVDPDPERWLPRRERSYYKGKRRDKRKEIGKGTQGSAAGASAEFDASKSPTPSASGSEIGSPRAGSQPPSGGAPAQPAAAAAPPGAGPRQQKPGGGGKQKKKKGKGGKW